MDLRELRHKAIEALASGRFARAEVMLRQLLLQAPRDGQLWVRHAETLRRMGRPADAAGSFRTGARVLGEDGHVARGIAAMKLALQLRPDDLDLISELIQLQQKRGRDAHLARKAYPAVLDLAGPLDARARSATLEFAMSDLGRPSAPRLALPPRSAVLDAEGNLESIPIEVGTLEVQPLAPTPPPVTSPYFRRLSDRAVAVQAGPGAPWVVVESASPVTLRQVD